MRPASHLTGKVFPAIAMAPWTQVSPLFNHIIPELFELRRGVA